MTNEKYVSFKYYKNLPYWFTYSSIISNNNFFVDLDYASATHKYAISKSINETEIKNILIRDFEFDRLKEKYKVQYKDILQDAHKFNECLKGLYNPEIDEHLFDRIKFELDYKNKVYELMVDDWQNGILKNYDNVYKYIFTNIENLKTSSYVISDEVLADTIFFHINLEEIKKIRNK